MAEQLLKSAYEVAREARLARNRQVLKELTQPEDEGEEEVEKVEVEDKKQAEKKKKKRVKEKIEPTRRSKRVQGLTPEGQKIEVDEPVDEEEEEEDSADVRMQAKIARLKALHAENKTTYKNSTVTYEHTWMRVRTMSDKALAKRIRVIEAALGQYCVPKMRMFAEVLVLADKKELAEEAQEALDRLLALGIK